MSKRGVLVTEQQDIAATKNCPVTNYQGAYSR